MIRPFAALAALLPSIALIAQVNIALVGQYDYQAARNSDLSNLWGYVDELGNEYALVGVNGDPNVPGTGGFSVVDVTDPANPVEVYFTPGPNSIWREIKTWGDFAYMTTEAQAGLFIIDLTPLPGGTPTVTLFNGNGWDTSHSLFIDENGRLYLHGANRGNGGVIMYDLTQDPNNPVEVGEFDQWYCHDSYARGDTLYAAHINDGFFSIVDVSDPANPVLLGTQFTPNNFTHNTWLDDSGQYLFTTDEKPNSYVAAYDVSDPTDIQEVDRLQTSPGSQAIVHNTYWLNDYVVQSYYTEGVSIYDVQDPTNMVEVGHYDTSPLTGDGFNGAWGVYPYLPSGRLLISDIEEGLFILEPTYVRGCYLEGTVTNAVTLAAVTNATVTILSTGVSTLSVFGGGFSMGYHTAGTYTVEVSAPGYFTATVPGVVLQNGVLTVQDVQLAPIPTATVEGEVVGPAPGQAGAVVMLDDGTQQYTGTTATDGSFVITGVTYGTYDVYVGLWGYQPLCLTGLVVDASTPAQTFTLLAGYADDFSLDLGWQQVAGGSSGTWVREAPVGTSNQGQPCAPGADVTGDCGQQAYVTGNGGGAPGDDDVDGGSQQLTSPPFDVSQMADPHVRFSYWFYNGGGFGPPNDTMRIALINGADTVDMVLATINGPLSQWVDTLVRISDLTTPGSDLRLYVEVADEAPGHLVEGGLDAFEVLADPFAGVAGLNGAGLLRLWPNPGADRFEVDARANEELRILDVQGRQVQGPQVLSSGVNTVNTALAEGIYLVRIEGAEGVRTARWVVQR